MAVRGPHLAVLATVPQGVKDDAAAPGRAREIAECAATGLLALAVFFFHLGSYGLWEPDEARYAEIPREMLASGNFLIPHLNYVPYIEKPPLLYWLTSLAFHFLGTNEFAARIVPALSALGGVVVTYWFARRAFDHRRAILAAAILVTSPIYASIAQVLTTDMLLTALLAAAFFSLFIQLREGGRCWIAAYLAMAFAVLTKGPVGIVLPVITAMLFLWWHSALRSGLAKLHPAAGLALVIAIAAPWFLLMAVKLPGYIEFYVIGEHLRRAFVSGYSHPQPLYFYLPVILGGMLPWTICFPLLLTDGTRGPTRSYCAIATAVVLGLFSMAGAKLIPYILPALPLLAVLLADSILSAIQNRRALWGWRIRRGAFITALGPTLSIGGVACFVIAASASHFRAPDFALVRHIVLIAGAILLAGGIAASVAFVRGRSEAGLAIVIVVVAATMVAGTYGRIDVESLHSWAPLSRALAVRAPGATLIVYRRYPQAIPFYTRHRVILASPFYSELRFGAEHSPDRAKYFLDTDTELLKLWNSDPSAVLIIDVVEMVRLEPRLGPLRIVAQQGPKFAIAKAQRPG
jgi:4-amino-4-deoxy-L-arabinose transferase-like glycosyltransferase